MIRKAVDSDLDGVEKIYDELHLAEEEGRAVIGWARGVYPVRATAEAALKRGDLFVLEDAGAEDPGAEDPGTEGPGTGACGTEILGAGIINRIQVDVYETAPWEHGADPEEVCVLHTLVISPRAGRRGLGRKFVEFYEAYAKEEHCPELRIDTNARNLAARAMYKKLGYKEIGIVPTVFNNIPGVDLVLLEKWLG